MKQKYYCVIVSILIFLLVAITLFVSKWACINCEDNNDKNLDKVSSAFFDDYTVSTQNDQETNNDLIDGIIEDTKYYRIVRSDLQIYCYFYNNTHEVVKVEGPMSKLPNITELDDNIVKFTLQAGTGVETRWGYYYDTDKTVFSEEFQGIATQVDGKVACVGFDRVIVSDIFDKSKYYKEFIDFSYPFSNVAAPISNVVFSEDGKSIKVSYLTGEDYKKVTEEFFCE